MIKRNIKNSIFAVKSLIILLIAVLPFQFLVAQNIYIDSCYSWAKLNYPLIRQNQLIQKSTAYSLENANKTNLPLLSINGQATYQSAVTNISIPGLNVPQVSKDQYKLYGEVIQPITNLFTLKDQKKLITANAAVQEQQINVEIDKLKERINNLYFGILLIDNQLQQTDLVSNDIQNGIERAKVAIANGVALRSSADQLQAQLLQVEQRKMELNANRQSYLDMLSQFIGKKLDANTLLTAPTYTSNNYRIRRPELQLFELQKQALDAQDLIIKNKTLPNFNLFFQGGIGRPAFNILSNKLEPYYIGGLRLNWNLSSFYTNKKEREILGLNRQLVAVQNDLFLFNTQLILTQQNGEICKLAALLESDRNIIALREQIKNTKRNQLEYGVATNKEYLDAVNDEDQARQNLALHQIQLLMAQYNYKTTSGN